MRNCSEITSKVQVGGAFIVKIFIIKNGDSMLQEDKENFWTYLELFLFSV